MAFSDVDRTTDLDNEFLEFREMWPPERKTAVVDIRSAHSGIRLGRIAWYGRWRQYCFYPEPDTIFNVGCMTTIMNRIEDLMERRTVGD